MTTVQRTVAALYATSGGMGDVGKFAVALAREQQAGEAAASGWQVRAIAMDSNDGANNGFGTSVDVEDEESKEKVDNWFVPYEMIKIDVASDSSERKIRESLEGVDAVISCLGNRQPKMERWCSVGTKKVINAMKANNIRRLVSLSSMGIGKDDFLKATALTCLWTIMLRTILRSVRKDLTSMEEEVLGSDLDYVLVRPVGLTPSEPPRGSCDRLLSRQDHGGRLEFMLAKSDAARFLLQEALTPTLHSREVTIGYYSKS